MSDRAATILIFLLVITCYELYKYVRKNFCWDNRKPPKPVKRSPVMQAKTPVVARVTEDREQAIIRRDTDRDLRSFRINRGR